MNVIDLSTLNLMAEGVFRRLSSSSFLEIEVKKSHEKIYTPASRLHARE